MSRIESSQSPIVTRSARPKAGLTAARPAAIVREPHPQRQAQRRRAQRVVDVVEPGEGELDIHRPRRGVEHEGGAAGPVQLDVMGGDGRLGPALAAVGAVVDAEVPQVDRVVFVGVAAAAAVLGVRGVLHLGGGHRRVLDAEVAHAGVLASEVGDQGVVRVGGQLRARRQGGHRRGPAVGDRLQLAVAVELIAEQVAQHDGPRAQLGQHPIKPELVELEQPELAVDRAAAARRPAAGSRRSPPAMLAPARLWTRVVPARSRIAAAIAAVVVLPLVEEMTAQPSGRRPARRSIAWGSRRVSTLPGRLVPPPRPARRASSPTARAAAILTSSMLTRRPDGSWRARASAPRRAARPR